MTGPGGRIVVAAAIVRDGRLLAAERAYPPELAGQWELPGGKVESGEADGEALVRECREELSVEIAVGPRIGAALPLAGMSGLLHVYACSLVAGEPRAGEHLALRWLSAAEVPDLPWLESNCPLVPDLQALLG